MSVHVEVLCGALEVLERVWNLGVKGDASTSHFCVSRERNWTSPVTIDLKSSTVHLIKQAEKWVYCCNTAQCFPSLMALTIFFTQVLFDGRQPSRPSAPVIRGMNDQILSPLVS